MKVINIEDIDAGTHIQISIFGIRIKIRPLIIKIKNLLAEEIAREVYSANEVLELHKKTFPYYKNIHNEDSIAIFGCGPTIQYYKNELDTVNIALNKALFLPDIKYTYSFAQDGRLLTTCPGYLEKIKNIECVKFIGKYLESQFFRNFPEIKNETEYNYKRYYSAAREWLPALSYGFKNIYPNIDSRPLADFGSVSFAALHFALYTYPQKIYLIGLDTNIGGYNYFDNKNGNYDTKKMLTGYKKFKEFATIYYPETEIISVNPVGLKGLFKDVYTQSYIDEHPELLEEDVEILDVNNCKELTGNCGDRL